MHLEKPPTNLTSKTELRFKWMRCSTSPKSCNPWKHVFVRRPQWQSLLAAQRAERWRWEMRCPGPRLWLTPDLILWEFHEIFPNCLLFWENCVAIYVCCFLLLPFPCWQSLSQTATFSSLNPSLGQSRREVSDTSMHNGNVWQRLGATGNPRGPRTLRSDLLLSPRVPHFHLSLVFPGFVSPWQEWPWVGGNHCKEN